MAELPHHPPPPKGQELFPVHHANEFPDVPPFMELVVIVPQVAVILENIELEPLEFPAPQVPIVIEYA